MVKMFKYKSLIINPQREHKAALKDYRLNRRLAFIFSKSDLAKFPAEEQKLHLSRSLKSYVLCF